MAEDDGITGISLNGVRRLIEDKKLPEDLLVAFSALFGAAIALSPIAAGPAGIALWSLLEPKDALVETAKAAIKKLTKSRPSDYLDQARRLATANTILTYTAFFDALRICQPDFDRALDFSEEKKSGIVKKAAAQVADLVARETGTQRPEAAPREDHSSSLAAEIISFAHPSANGEASVEFRRQLYLKMIGQIKRDLSRDLTAQHGKLFDMLENRIPALAESVYLAEFLGMVIDYQPFLVWSTLQDRADKDALLRALVGGLRAAGEDSQLRFELLGAALHKLDLGLDRLSCAIAAQPAPSPGGPCLPESKAAKAAEALRDRYAAAADRPVIDDRYDPLTGGPRLRYPGSASAYVPQAYRQVRYAVGDTHLEHDGEWEKLPVADDLGPAITRYLESPYSAGSPLLILGHPGSGKSLLTRVYAARLQYPRYTVVRVELRDANPAVSIQKQVEDQIRKDTGYDVNWADLADNLPLSPPIVILDGYDELLQATGKLFTDYIDQVQRFQRDALISRRPVRVIVTSRITLIDKAIVPPGTTVMRLEPFDEARRTEWIARWNACNTEYFQQSAVKPFKLSDNPKLVELAEQPLLLLMLAIFDATGNPLSARADLDQTQLYDELLRRFIERELGKGEHGAAFSGLRPETRRPLVDRELYRLGVAAIGMFNRQEVRILRDQLDSDLAYFGAERQLTSDLYGQSQSELLLGSFFFIHESRTRLAVAGVPSAAPAGHAGLPRSASEGSAALAGGATAFEFLHNTFGEFLAADFILRHVIENAEATRDLTGRPTLEHARQQHLTSLTPHWFACLLYTPLHTRPNILAMLREWSAHRIPADFAARAGLLSSLDEIIRAQLRAVLSGIGPLDPANRARLTSPTEASPPPLPYSSLPVIGQAAVYTLNLILLRTYLSDEYWTFDEPALDVGDRPWDRLTALWRSWFTLESLGTLATQFAATRTGEQLTLTPTASELIVPPGSPLSVAYNVAIALADNLTAESMGLHVTSLTTRMEASQYLLPRLLSRFDDETRPLAPIADSARRRLDGYYPELPAGVLAELTRIDFRTSELMLSYAEFADRVVLSQRERVKIPRHRVGGLTEVTTLSRYAAAVLTHLCVELDPGWLQDLLFGPQGSPGSRPEDFQRLWRVFLRSPAAAPVLRAAMRRLSPAQCEQVTDFVVDAWSGGEISLFDVDTAAALAVLAWRGSDKKLCAWAIDAILRGHEHDDWSLLDIPLETWDYLADLFVGGGPTLAGRRGEFARILDDQLANLIPIMAASKSRVDELTLQMPELLLHAFRIGSVRYRDEFLKYLIPLAKDDTIGVVERRRWFLLLLRWARENDKTVFVVNIVSGAAGTGIGEWWTNFGAAHGDGPRAINLDRACADLSYREVTDLCWALGVWRESGAHWLGEYSGREYFRPAPQVPGPLPKRRSSRP